MLAPNDPGAPDQGLRQAAEVVSLGWRGVSRPCLSRFSGATVINKLMKKFLSGGALACAGLCAFAPGARAETIKVYTSANFAPLVLHGGGGIYPDLVDYLNRKNLAPYTFTLSYLPRKRLQVQLEEGSLDGIVIGMMPQWFDDLAQKKYLWTAPFAADRFLLVSNAAHPIGAQPAAALAGARIGMTLGYVYPGIDEWVRRNGLVRSDAPSEEKSLDKLLLNRVDCSAVVESVVRYYIKTRGLQGKFMLAPLPGPDTERRFLMPHAQKAVYDKLAPLLNKLKDDAEWQRLMARYQ